MVTDQGKPDRCPTCGSAPCQHEPSPVPAAAPQAESVPSGRDAAREWLQREHSAFVDAINHGCVILPEDVASKCEQYAASQTASLQEKYTELGTAFKCDRAAREAAERENSLLRERLNAAIRLFGEIETIDQPYLVFERDFWKRITDFAAQKEKP